MSPRHLRFARLIAAGDTTIKDCYLAVYPTVKEGVARTNGSRLLSRAHIKAYVEAITGAAAELAIVSREEILGRLWEVGNGAVYGNDPKAANATASALKTLLDGVSPKDKTSRRVEVTGADGGPVVEEVTHKGLSKGATRSIITQTLGLTDEQAARFLGEEKTDDES